MTNDATINLFDEEITSASLFDESVDQTGETHEEGVKEKEEDTPPIDPGNLFGQEEGKDEKDKNTEVDDASSFKKTSYQLVAEGLFEDGIFPDLKEDDIKEVDTAEKFSQIIEKQVAARFDEKQKRIDEALSNNVPVDQIKTYENTMQYLENITEEDINSETEDGENLRKQLIYRDFVNRGFTKERAAKEVEKSVKSGNDIEDAKEALDSNKTYFKEEYENLLKAKKEEAEAIKKKQSENIEKLNEKINKTDKPFDGIQLNDSLKKKIGDNMRKPVHKDEEGYSYNAIQKYAKDNPVEYNYNVAVLYTLTNGFTDIDGLVKQVVQKEKQKHISSLERKLSNMRLDNNGTYDMDPVYDAESIILDI